MIVTFRHVEPRARSVLLASDFTEWGRAPLPLQRQLSGIWTVKVDLEPGDYSYKYVVDGQWIPDRARCETVPDGYGGVNSLRRVARSRATSCGRLGDVEFPLGSLSVFELPMLAAAPATSGKLSPQTASSPEILGEDVVRVGLAVPPDFIPDRFYYVLVVNATLQASNIQHLEHCFAGPAMERDWIAIATDAAASSPDDSTPRRWSLLATALRELHVHWPASRRWPFACGGFSGGAKRSGTFGAILAKKGYKVAGIWMGGCNADTASRGLTDYGPKREAYLRTPVFLSSGSRDTVATPAHVERVQKSMERTGFSRVRLESYEGAHHPHIEHVVSGLEWFRSLLRAC